jgi:hypothetical protein
MTYQIRKIITNLKEEELNIFFKEIFNSHSNKSVYHIKRNKIYIYNKEKVNQLTIYVFSKEEKTSPKINEIQTIYINKIQAYKSYKNNKYNNITLLATLFNNLKEEETIDIINKMNISIKEKLISIIKER